MNAIVTPKKSSNIETALVKAFSSILLSHLTLSCIKLKSKVSKFEMTLNGNILSNRIYFDADDKHFKIPTYVMLTLKGGRKEKASITNFFKRCVFRLDYPTKRLYEFPF